MKRSCVLCYLLYLMGILLLMTGCTEPPEQRVQAPSVSVTSPPRPLTQLRPESALPSSCPATPVYQGGQGSLAGIPWFQAQPTSSDIVGHLFFAQGKTTKKCPSVQILFFIENYHLHRNPIHFGLTFALIKFIFLEKGELR
jgi:hypothetical protein